MLLLTDSLNQDQIACIPFQPMIRNLHFETEADIIFGKAHILLSSEPIKKPEFMANSGCEA